MTSENAQLNDTQARRKGSERRGWLRPAAIIIACLVVVIALFYVEENWRGKRAWDRARTELLGKGARLDWAAFIPAPVPDEQNIFKAPHMQNWFVKGEAGEFSKRLSNEANTIPQASARGEVRVLGLRVVPPGTGGENAIRFRAAAVAGTLQQLIRGAIGSTLNGAQGITLCLRPLNEVKAASVVLEADPAPDADQLKALLPPKSSAPGDAEFVLRPAAAGGFAVVMDAPRNWYTAADYLASTAKFEPDFELMREALKRPCARMEGDYGKPYDFPIPNFVAMRAVAQTLAQRAQAYLLLGQGAAAERELALVRDMCRLLEAPPDGKPMTLVAAMINVAITGLYTAVVQDGLRLGVWQEPQLKALQAQCARIDLLPFVYRAFEGERAAVCHMLGALDRSVLESVFAGLGDPKSSVWARITKDPASLLVLLGPRGWFDQNMATVAVLEQKMLDGLDLTNRIVFPARCKSLGQELSTTLDHFSPATFLAAVAIPNSVRASETMARNQTQARQAQVACALERYRLAQGHYPENLEALVPEFTAQLPHDVIGGKPLNYRRASDAGFILYSVGWNERDDGGTIAKENAEGDWVLEHRRP